MTYSLAWENKGVFWKYTGTVSGEEIIEASTKIYGDPRFDALDYKLVDFTEADAIQISNEQVMLLAFQHQAAEQSNANMITAIVCDDNFQPAHDFANLFKDSNWEIKIFPSLEEARLYLADR